MLERLFSRVLSDEVLTSKTVTLPFVAFLFALGIAAVGYFLFAAGNADIQGKAIVVHFGSIPVPLQVLIFSLFVFSFVLIWFLLFSQFASETHDVYSSLRKKLIGNWTVQYEIEPGQRYTEIWHPLPAIACTLALNPVAKLEIRYIVKDNPLYANASQIIQGISITHTSENKYYFSYYYKNNRELSPHLAHLLMNEKDEGPLEEIEVEVFVILEFEDIRTRKSIDSLRGRWFDLNGNLIRLFSLGAEFEKHADDQVQVRRRLSDAKVDRENFKALMGDVTFSRIAPIASSDTSNS